MPLDHLLVHYVARRIVRRIDRGSRLGSFIGAAAGGASGFAAGWCLWQFDAAGFFGQALEVILGIAGALAGACLGASFPRRRHTSPVPVHHPRDEFVPLSRVPPTIRVTNLNAALGDLAFGLVAIVPGGVALYFSRREPTTETLLTVAGVLFIAAGLVIWTRFARTVLWLDLGQEIAVQRLLSRQLYQATDLRVWGFVVGNQILQAPQAGSVPFLIKFSNGFRFRVAVPSTLTGKIAATLTVIQMNVRGKATQTASGSLQSGMTAGMADAQRKRMVYAALMSGALLPLVLCVVESVSIEPQTEDSRFTATSENPGAGKTVTRHAATAPAIDAGKALEASSTSTGPAVTQPTTRAAAATSRPAVRVVYSDNGDAVKLSDEQMLEVLNSARSVQPLERDIWFIFVAANNGEHLRARVYFVPDKATDELRRGGLAAFETGWGVAQLGYVQVCPAAHPFGKQFDLPTLENLPFRPPRVHTTGKPAKMGEHELTRLVWFVRQALAESLFVTPNDRNAPILDIEETDEDVVVRTGRSAGFLNGRGLLLHIKHEGNLFRLVDIERWVS